MELSKRLSAVASYVTHGNSVVDVGCDHGYVSIYLIKQKISPYVIAVDVNKGPLEKAKENSIRYGVSEYITTRISDGLNGLQEGEVQTLICAGMGGRLMIRILQEGITKLTYMEECILQPQSELEYFRKNIRTLGFVIVGEKIIHEDGKFYPIMKVVSNHKIQEAIENPILEDKFGGFLLKERNPVLLKYLNKEKEKYQKIDKDLSKTKESSTHSIQRIVEIQSEIQMIEEAISYYYDN